MENELELISKASVAYDQSKLRYFDPYPFQRRFFHARTDDGEIPSIRGLMAANQVGKTLCAAAEVAYHATGIYPKDWEGKVFRKAPKILVSGVTNETLKKIGQKELLGDPEMGPGEFGTGMIPKDLIVGYTMKRGVPDAVESVRVKHISGRESILHFTAYEAGKMKFMGVKYDLIWPDEEPPMDIWQQFLRSQITTNGIIMFTFTPESGYTELVTQLLNEPKPTDFVMHATWWDAPHIYKDPKRMKELTEMFRPDELEMRSKGIPTVGSGLVYSVPDDQLRIDPIHLPDHWPRIVGIDFGWEHPFAAVWLAWDRESDTIYVYDEYAVKKERPSTHASAIKKRGEWIPISWPRDGLNTEKGTGIQLAQQYRDEGLNLFYEHFTNPPPDGLPEGQGGYSVETGVMHLYERMLQGRLKVFSTCQNFFKEKNLYHRKDGRIVPRNDDILSATRYGACFIRHAQLPLAGRKKKPSRLHKYKGARMWQQG